MGAKGINVYSMSQSPFLCRVEGADDNRTDAPNKIFETFLFMFGEYSPKVPVKIFVISLVMTK